METMTETGARDADSRLTPLQGSTACSCDLLRAAAADPVVQLALADALAAGQQLFVVGAVIDRDPPWSSVRVLQVLLDLASAGRVVRSLPSITQLEGGAESREVLALVATPHPLLTLGRLVAAIPEVEVTEITPANAAALGLRAIGSPEYVA